MGRVNFGYTGCLSVLQLPRELINQVTVLEVRHAVKRGIWHGNNMASGRSLFGTICSTVISPVVVLRHGPAATLREMTVLVQTTTTHSLVKYTLGCNSSA